MSDKPLLYVILGAAGSGRRAIVADLFSEEIAEAKDFAVLLSDREAEDAAEEKLGEITGWSWEGEGTIAGTVPPGTKTAVFVTDGRLSPVDQIEALKPWMATQGLELGRILVVVNCKLAFDNPGMAAWYDACIHFADAVLLNHRDGVPNKWISEFQEKFAKLYYPALFEFVKDGHLKNPALLLSPVPRRMTHYFEEDQDWIVINDEGEEEDEDEIEEDGDEEVEMVVVEDPYFVKRLNGRREKEVPDVTRFLDKRD